MGFSVWTAVFAALALVLGVVLWSARRHRSPRISIECEGRIDELMPSLAGLTLGTALPGNSVEVLENGRFFDVLVERIGQARRTVHFETFLWKPGQAGRRVAGALAERARAGITVRVLLDAIGSRRIGPDERRTMEAAGCRVRFFHRHS